MPGTRTMSTLPSTTRARRVPVRGLMMTALLGLAAAALLTGCGRTESAPEPVRAVRSVIVGAGSAGVRQEYAAEIRARTESRLGFRVGGKLIERPVRPGDMVRKGQVLARLDPQDLRLVEQAALAGVQAAQAAAAQAEADLQRFRGLFDQGFISAAELERRTTAVATAKAQLAQAQAQADAQGRQTSHGTLLADAPGVITAVDAEPGTVVAAGAPVVRLAWDGPREAAFAVPEDRVDLIRSLLGKAGALRVTMWDQPGSARRATVREVAGAADPVTRTFAVRADLVASPRAPSPRLGQTAVVAIELHGDGVIKLPLTAIFEDQGRSAVWVLDQGTMTVRVQAVGIGGADGNEAVVAGGLRPGQEVVTAGVHLLTPGQKVRRHGTGGAAAGGAPPTRASEPAAASSAAPR